MVKLSFSQYFRI